MKRKFTKEHCRNISKNKKGKFKGFKNPHWKGGRIKMGEESKYIGIYSPTHPYATKLGYVLEHRLLMEKHLGRTLLPIEVVHHINGDVADNRIENLLLHSSQSKHAFIHNKDRKRNPKGQFIN